MLIHFTLELSDCISTRVILKLHIYKLPIMHRFSLKNINIMVLIILNIYILILYFLRGTTYLLSREDNYLPSLTGIPFDLFL